jgi:hypothetical protein
MTKAVSPDALQEALEQRAREVQVAHADENHQMLKDAVRVQAAYVSPQECLQSCDAIACLDE